MFTHARYMHTCIFWQLWWEGGYDSAWVVKQDSEVEVLSWSPQSFQSFLTDRVAPSSSGMKDICVTVLPYCCWRGMTDDPWRSLRRRKGCNFECWKGGASWCWTLTGIVNKMMWNIFFVSWEGSTHTYLTLYCNTLFSSQ